MVKTVTKNPEAFT